jgi:hypothetical protein
VLLYFPARLFSRGKGARLAVSPRCTEALRPPLDSPALVWPLLVLLIFLLRALKFFFNLSCFSLLVPPAVCSAGVFFALDVFTVCMRIWVTRDFLRRSLRAICLRA